MLQMLVDRLARLTEPYPFIQGESLYLWILQHIAIDLCKATDSVIFCSSIPLG